MARRSVRPRRRRSGGTLLCALRHDEMARHFERARVDFHEHVVHHADRVVLGALRIDPRAVRHDARRNPRHLHHLAGGDDRHRRRHHVAVEVEVDRVQKLPVRRRVEGRRKHAEGHAADDRIAGGRILPDRAEWLPVRQRHVIEPMVRRHRETVRSVDFSRHDAGRHDVIEASPIWSEPHEADAVRRFGGDVHDVFGCRRLRRSFGRSEKGEDDRSGAQRYES